MPDRKTHFALGAASGGVTTLFRNLNKQQELAQGNPDYQFDWVELIKDVLTGVGFGALGGIAPDILEPACHPNHRKVCHSLGAGCLVVQGMNTLSQHEEVPEFWKNAGVAFGAGYLSHQIADLATPKGLPIVGL